MAKKAGGNTTTTWVPLLEARALVVRAYGAVHKAEELLKKWLGDGRVRWSCRLFEPARVSELAVGRGLFVAKAAYSEGDPAFWRISLEINWEEGSAREKYVVGGTAAYGIRVAREDVRALLPGAPGGASKIWIIAEVQQMKAAGKIPPTITELAHELERRMEKAARAGAVKKKVGWLHIKNELPGWGLWPI